MRKEVLQPGERERERERENNKNQQKIKSNMIMKEIS